MLCQVTLGNVQMIRPGSNQYAPSEEDYEKGINDPNNPRRYIYGPKT